jgi:uncharacterized membrane protein
MPPSPAVPDLDIPESDVAQLATRSDFIAALAGAVIGAAGAYPLARFASRLVYQVSAHAPRAFATAPMALVVISLSATYNRTRCGER